MSTIQVLALISLILLVNGIQLFIYDMMESDMQLRYMLGFLKLGSAIAVFLISWILYNLAFM